MLLLNRQLDGVVGSLGVSASPGDIEERTLFGSPHVHSWNVHSTCAQRVPVSERQRTDDLVGSIIAIAGRAIGATKEEDLLITLFVTILGLVIPLLATTRSEHLSTIEERSRVRHGATHPLVGAIRAQDR